jgi:hypothetical protein
MLWRHGRSLKAANSKSSFYSVAPALQRLFFLLFADSFPLSSCGADCLSIPFVNTRKAARPVTEKESRAGDRCFVRKRQRQTILRVFSVTVRFSAFAEM